MPKVVAVVIVAALCSVSAHQTGHVRSTGPPDDDKAHAHAPAYSAHDNVSKSNILDKIEHIYRHI